MDDFIITINHIIYSWRILSIILIFVNFVLKALIKIYRVLIECQILIEHWENSSKKADMVYFQIAYIQRSIDKYKSANYLKKLKNRKMAHSNKDYYESKTETECGPNDSKLFLYSQDRKGP